MAQSNNSIKKILTVAFALCIVCSIIVSTAAVALRSKQQLNQELDRKTNILNVADLYEPGDDVAEEFQKITPRVIDLRNGEYTDEYDPDSFNNFEAAKDPAQSRTLSGEKDIAGLSRQENYTTVYLVGDPDDPEQVILPIRGQGLWGLMRGYLAVEGDGNTIVGITYYSHSETPGLGGEVDNPKWKAQWEGKEIYGEDGDMNPAIALVKGGASSDTEVDALSGASLTSKGVTNMLQFWLGPEGFGPYLAKFRSGTDQEAANTASADETEGA
ncbi:Na(+)-translocating NADH-quinone reductase subunit C [Halomonas elongata]|uniref:Na(+)-translocating NADH-quinone reductase subunit C n=3 Tax=Halomonas elongata TaxID=2746 RepID=E1VB40_HALED|nr:Na(+)-translocating NADH-quinone reductase subunit C [Halomonas elongata]MDL4861987.1 Na(+)-translocating NADH-quinone reductase subunit C [Halomonas elongata]WBF19372.1 Na(+)-translocating NADH-quinone reductase subunit C [Halomonas elongata]WPU48232.1 Na(+)-translocating NADH-quinone reductase subunit C [Halomonas elongata DSM 2581]WVI72827.1 Na(+)-translocating NADH-quinone reductase subunit C [Halomonas elongata]CBV42101.1 sodium-translocating NADH-quinone reductase subunit C [Halomonas